MLRGLGDKPGVRGLRLEDVPETLRYMEMGIIRRADSEKTAMIDRFADVIREFLHGQRAVQWQRCGEEPENGRDPLDFLGSVQ